MGGAVSAVERFLEWALVGLLGSGLLALVSTGYVDGLSLALGGAGLLGRLLRVSCSVPRGLPLGWAAGLAVAGLAGGALDFALVSRDWRGAGVHVVFFLAALAMLAARPGRDHLWLGLGALLALLAASWWSANLYFLAALAAFLLFGVAAFASAELRRSAQRPGHVVQTPKPRLAGRLAVLSLLVAGGILALTAVLFFVLPRTAQVAFRRLAPERFQAAASSEEVRLGPFGRVRRQETLLARVRLYGARPPGPLKWRGNALERFDGRRWSSAVQGGERLTASAGLVKVAENSQLWRSGRRIVYEVRRGDLASDALYLAGIPEFLWVDAPAVVRTASGVYRLSAAQGARYGVSAFLEPGELPKTDPAGAAAAPPACCLELPRLDPRIRELARQVTAGLGAAEQRAEALIAHLQRAYAYTTKSPSDQAADPLVDFLFGSRQGHCEYFATALAVMLRSVGIPARVLTGFQSGLHNPVSGWEVIRASDAHSWVEAWLPRRGWAALDATPPQPPAARRGAWTRLGWYLDAAETFWDEWVLRYDLSRQMVLAARMESSGRDLSTHWMDRARARVGQLQTKVTQWGRRYGLALLGVLAVAAGAWAGAPRLHAGWRSRRRWRLAARGVAEVADATLLYQRMLTLLARRGFRKSPFQTPVEFARRLPASPLASLVEEFTEAYNDLRFGAQRRVAPRLAALLVRIREARGARGSA